MSIGLAVLLVVFAVLLLLNAPVAIVIGVADPLLELRHVIRWLAGWALLDSKRIGGKKTRAKSNSSKGRKGAGDKLATRSKRRRPGR